MKMTEIVAKTDQELTDLVTTNRKRLAELAVDMRVKNVTNVKEIRGAKKTIAQALTIQRERAIEKQEASHA